MNVKDLIVDEIEKKKIMAKQKQHHFQMNWPQKSENRHV